MRPVPRDVASTWLVAGFAALAIALAVTFDAAPVAIYSLAGWHYCLYWFAFVFATVPLRVLKRDALLTKSVALATLGWAYLSEPPDPLSLALVGGGFLLNAAAAAALGSDRTYYGREVAGMPPMRVTGFPYSLVAHPMLVGNLVAFGGTLVNAAFRERWWPLALLHVAMNAALWWMEARVQPRSGESGSRRASRGAVAAGAVALVALAAVGIAAASLPLPAAAVLVTAALATMAGLLRTYVATTAARKVSGIRREVRHERGP